jgi:hypothetical protein
MKKAIQTKETPPLVMDNVISLDNPEENADVLPYLLRSGARELITKAVQSELVEFSRYDRF